MSPSRSALASSSLRPSALETRWTAPHMRHGPSNHAIGFPFQQRYASIPPTQLPHSKLPDGSIPPPDPPRKPKVELRPSPKLLDSSTTRPAGSSLSAVPPAVSPISSAVASSSTQQPPARERHIPLRSAIDSAIADVQQAARSGDIAPPPPGANLIRKGIHYAIELLKFYWRGMKAIFRNREIVRQIQDRVREESREMSWREKRFVDMYKSDRIKYAFLSLGEGFLLTFS